MNTQSVKMMRLAVLAASLGVVLIVFLHFRQNSEFRKGEGSGGQHARTSLVPATRHEAAVTSTNSNPAISPAGQSPVGNTSVPRVDADARGAGVLEKQRSILLSSPYGTAPIKDVIRALKETPGGPDIQLIFQVLALRKREALPLVKEGLQKGEMWEKNMLTKFLRLCPWPETQPELLALATAKTGNWLPRQGALYALGSLGDASIGPEAVAILTAAESRDNLQMAAISTIARVGYRDGATAISGFLENDNIHVRLFATCALAELGEPVNKEFLLAALQNADYVVRQEASETLWAVAGQDITEKLQAVAKSDFSEAVRDAAAQSLLRRELQGRNAAEKVAILKSALDGTERLTALWILRTMLEQGGEEGRAAVSQLTTREDRLGERARAYLIFSSGTGS